MADPVFDYSSAFDPTEGAKTGGGIGAEFSSGVHGANAALNAIPAAMGSRGAFENMVDEQRLAAAAGQRAGEAGIPQSLTDVHGPVDLLKMAGGQAVAAAPQLAAVGIGGLAAGPAGAAAAAAPLAFGGNLATQYGQSGKFDIPSAAALAVPETALNAVAPEARLFQKGEKAVAAIETGSRVGNAAARGAVTAVSQGGVGAGLGELNEMAKASVDPNYDLASDGSLAEVAGGAAGGAIMGGIMGGVHGAWHTPADIAAKNLPEQSTSPDATPNDPYNLLQSPTFMRRGGATDERGMPVSNPSGQGDLFSGEVRGARGGERPTAAEAANQGPTTQDAIDGLTQMHSDLNDQLRQHLLAGSDTDTIAAVQQQIAAVRGHLDVLSQGDDMKQGDLFADNPVVQRMGTGLDVPPATPNPDAQIAPANPAPTPNPDAKLIVPNRPTVGDQLIDAQRQRAQGRVLSADQASLLRRPPEQPVGPQIVTPDAKPGFQLTPDRRTFGEPEARPPFQLEAQEPAHPGQQELPLEHAPEAPAADTKSGDLFSEGTYGSKAPWTTRMRIAWKDASDGSLQGFHKSMKDALGAKTPEEAAQIIRDKADNQSNQTSFAKLDAMHRALTGETLEEHATREASKPVEPIVEDAGGGEAASPRSENGTVAETEPAAREPKEVAPEKPVKKSQDAKRTEDESKLNDILARLETTKKPDEFQSIADDLYAHSQDAQTRAGRDAATDALNDLKNGFTDENLHEAEARYDARDMERQERINDALLAKVNRHSADTDAGSALVHGSPRTGADMVNHLASTAVNAAVRHVMGLVSKHVDLSKVNVERNMPGDRVHPEIARAFAEDADGAIARYPDGRMAVHISPSAGEEGIAHELVHAATLAALDDKAKATPFEALMNEMKSRLPKDDPEAALFDKHALGDVKEFVAYASTSPRMRALMDSITPTLRERFAAAVRKVLGIPKAFYDKLMGRESKSGYASGIKGRFDTALRHLIEDQSPEAVAHAAEVKFHAFSTSAEGMVDGLKDAGDTIWSRVKATANKAMLGAMPTHQITSAFSHIVRSLPDVQHAIEARTARQHQLARGGAEVHDALNAAFKEAKSLDRLHSVFEDAQTANIDPRTEPMDRVQAYLRTAKQKLDALPKNASQLERLRAEDHMKRAAAGVRLKDNWTKMTEPEKKAFALAVEKLKASMQARQDAANEILLRSKDAFSDPILDKLRAEGADEKVIDQHIIDTYGKEFKVMDGAYAPLKRFGEWAVVRSSPEYRAAEAEAREARIAAAGERANGEVSDKTRQRLQDAQETLRLMMRDGAHREVTFHESSADATKARRAAQSQYPGHEVQRFTRNEYGKAVTAANGATIERIMSAVGKELPPELSKHVESIIRDMYVDALPDGSFAQTQQMRSGVAGYSMDFSRSILDQLLRDSFQISTLEHSERIGEAMSSLDEERKKIGSDLANNVHDTLAARIDASMNFRNFARWEQNISQLTHVAYLGASPAFLLMNMMQMPMITVPMLHARFGIGKVEAPLTKAIGDVWKAIEKGRFNENASHFSDAEKQVLAHLQNLGILNMTQLHDTANAARSANIIDPKTLGEKTSKGTEAAVNLVNLPAQYVETVNRAASALVAYRLAREGSAKFGKMDHGQAMDYATKIVRDSHVDYGAANNPAWMKNGFMPGSRLLFQFKKYWLNMLSMVSVNMYDSFGHHSEIKALRNALADKNISPDQAAEHQEMLRQLMDRRAVARRTLAGLYGMHLLHTGALGMPFAGAGIGLANIMRNWFNDPEDKANTEADLRNYVAEAFGTTASDTLFHGIWAGLFGAGISARIGMGDLANPVRVFGGTSSNKDYAKELLIGAMGPTVGLALNYVGAMDKFEAGDYAKGTEMLLPKAAGDVLKAVRRENAGGEVSNGKMVAPTDERDAVLQALGITPEHVINAYTAKEAVSESKNAFSGERSKLLKAAATAGAQGDSEARTSAMEDIAAFNDRNPGKGLRITQSEVVKMQHSMLHPKPQSSTQKAKAAYFNAEGEFAKDE